MAVEMGREVPGASSGANVVAVASTSAIDFEYHVGRRPRTAVNQLEITRFGGMQASELH